ADRADGDTILLGRSGDSGHGDADVGMQDATRAFGHLRRRLLAHHRIRRDAEDLTLDLGCVRADRAAERLARTGHARDARADEPTGYRFRDAERPPAIAQSREHRVFHRLVVDREYEITENRTQLAFLFGRNLARRRFGLALG